MLRAEWISRRDQIAAQYGDGQWGLDRANEAMLLAVGECPGPDDRVFPVFDLLGTNNESVHLDETVTGHVGIYLKSGVPYLDSRQCLELAAALTAAAEWQEHRP